MRLKYLKALLSHHKEKRDLFHNLFVHPSTPKDQMWFVEFILAHYSLSYAQTEKQIATVKRSIDYFNALPESSTSAPSFDLLTLKAIPIDSIVEVDMRNKFRIRDERTASAHYYKQNNKWYDFGSGEGGDVIDLVMRINNCSFVEACKYLSMSFTS